MWKSRRIASLASVIGVLAGFVGSGAVANAAVSNRTGAVTMPARSALSGEQYRSDEFPNAKAGANPPGTFVGPSPSGQGSGSFEVVGNKIMAPNGRQFVPYGVVIQCASLKNRNVTALCTGNDASDNTGSAIINAAATVWNANIVRLQVAQEDLFSGPNGSVNQSYVDLVDNLVNQANSLGMVATITLQEENEDGPVFPTTSSLAFWQFMAGHFKNYPDVFFDLFNEPDLPAAAFGNAGTESDIWSTWQNGGAAMSDNAGALDAPNTNYVGMQTLVNAVRWQGANNIVVAEGPDSDKDLTELTTHYLVGKNIAYGVEPNLHGDFTEKQQYNRFGQYAATVPIMPEAFLDTYGTESCDPGSPLDVPEVLNYLKSLNMGLIFWSLDPGVGIIGNNLDTPTFYPNGAQSISSSECPFTGGGQATLPNNTVGDGADIQTYFKANSVQIPR